MTAGTGAPRGTWSVACLDMAGTTITDAGTVRTAFEAALAAMGLAPGDRRFERAMATIDATMGQSKIEVFRNVAGHVVGDGADPEPLAQAANTAFERRYQVSLEAGLVEPVPGAAATITALRAAGIAVCLTTGFSAPTRERLLAAVGWQSMADLVLSPAGGIRGRPWPDLPLTALLRLGGGAVSELVVVGDTPADMECGVRAGAGAVIGVLTGWASAADLTAAGARAVVPSVVDVAALLGIPTDQEATGRESS